jgi:hypothetical protein
MTAEIAIYACMMNWINCHRQKQGQNRGKGSLVCFGSERK